MRLDRGVSYAVDLRAIRAAEARISGFVHRTPVLTCRALDERYGRRLFLKGEHLQRGGAFKARGAHNAILKLPRAVAARGVVTHSSGNHAQAVALAARSRGVAAHIVMPSDAPAVKQAAVRGYGAAMTLCEPTLQSREQTACEVCLRTGGVFIPPYDHPDVIAGQGTMALELLRQVPELDAIVAPVGGGGMVSGVALACRELAPHVPVYAAEPAGADDAARSRARGERIASHTPHTEADGLRTTLGELTWPVVRDVVEDVLVVEEAAMIQALRRVLERAKQWIEPSAAVAVAACAQLPPERRRVGVILSGGNVDPLRLGRLLDGHASSG
jgi:threonine dehydratase